MVHFLVNNYLETWNTSTGTIKIQHGLWKVDTTGTSATSSNIQFPLRTSKRFCHGLFVEPCFIPAWLDFLFANLKCFQPFFWNKLNACFEWNWQYLLFVALPRIQSKKLFVQSTFNNMLCHWKVFLHSPADATIGVRVIDSFKRNWSPGEYYDTVSNINL